MKIYFAGIGGVGIGPLAMIAQDMGHEVLGSDKELSAVAKELQVRDIQIDLEQDGSFIRNQHESEAIDLFVYSSAITKDHPELTFANGAGISSVKRHDLLNLLITRSGLKVIAVAGTHGKTTTTGMLCWLFEKAGVPYSHSVGAQLSFAPIGRHQKGSQYFIYEADEFDRNFLHFKPYASLITSIDFDHADTYENQDDYDNAFVKFISQSEKVILWDDDTTRFNVAESPTIRILDSASYRNHKFPNKIGLKLSGVHNRMNATLVAEFNDKELNIDMEKIVGILNDFPGTSRRFEQIADSLYSDYAHHPTEIRASLELALELNDHIVCVYQPHQNIRQHYIKNHGGYGNCFEPAEKVYLLPTYLSREDINLETLSPQQVKEMIEHPDVATAAMDDALISDIKGFIEAGYLVVTMNAGDLDPWLRHKFNVY